MQLIFKNILHIDGLDDSLDFMIICAVSLNDYGVFLDHLDNYSDLISDSQMSSLLNESFGSYECINRNIGVSLRSIINKGFMVEDITIMGMDTLVIFTPE